MRKPLGLLRAGPVEHGHFLSLKSQNMKEAKSMVSKPLPAYIDFFSSKGSNSPVRTVIISLGQS